DHTPGFERAADEVALEAGCVVMAGRDVHVVRPALVDQGSRVQGRTPLPLLDDPRITRCGHRAGAEIGIHVYGVAIDPAQGSLGFLAVETAFHPAPAGKIELAGDVRIRATARKRDQAAAVVG